MSDELVPVMVQSRDEAGKARGNGNFSLWIGLLLPPITWASQMQFNYWLVRGACARGSNAALFAVTLISLLLVILAAFSSFLGWQRVREKWPGSFGDRVTRDRFMAVMGLLMAGIFFVVVVAQGIAAIIFHPCQL